MERTVMGMPYKEYLNHWLWLEKRELLIKHANYTCQRCGTSRVKDVWDWEERDDGLQQKAIILIATNPNLILQVHHLNYNNLGNEKPSDVIVLCKKCHQKEHGREF